MNEKGYTLIELVVVITILGIIALVPSAALLESAKIYARTVPTLDATYQARFAVERMKSDVRDMQDGSITTFTSTALTFKLSSGQSIAYTLSGSTLLRNGDLLAKGVTALSISYKQKDGTTAALASDLNLVEIDLMVQTADQPYRVQIAVYPRGLGV